LNVKITDFDFARIGLNEESAFIEKSTPQYSPPEFLLNNKCYYQSDIFAFGLVIFFLFTEQDFFGAEFAGVNSEETIENVKKYYTKHKGNNVAVEMEKVKSAFKVFHTWNELSEILEKCFQENHRSRYASFDDIIQVEDKSAKKNRNQQDKDGPKLIKRFEYIGKQETNKFDKEVKDAVDFIWSKCGGGNQSIDTEAPFNKFLEQFTAYFNDPEILVTKEGDKISDEEIIKKYLFLTITNKTNLNEYRLEPNNNIEVSKDKFEKFMALYGKGLLEYKNDKKDGTKCITKMYNDLWSQNWYWEDTSRELTRNALSALHDTHEFNAPSRKDKKKDKKKEPKRVNYFLVRNGFERQNTFTLEILLYSFDYIQKISIEDYSTVLKIVKNLKSHKNHFEDCFRSSTKIEKIQTTDLERRKKEKKRIEKDKKREEEREREKKRREANPPKKIPEYSSS